MFLECSYPNSVFKLFGILNLANIIILENNKDVCVYDMPPTVIKDLIVALMTKKNWSLM